MDGEQYERHLVAILAADLVGYSRLMGLDEGRTLSRLKHVLMTIISPVIRNNHGRLVKTIGDGLIAEFGSVVNAIRCAIEIQRDVTENQIGEPEASVLRFRIGINVGDVIYDGEDVFGDGVNIAARLESVAAPAEICVSGAVRDAVRGKMKVVFEDRGEKEFKNISDAVHVFAVSWDPADWKPTIVQHIRQAEAAGAPRKRGYRTPVMIALIGILAVIAGVVGVRAMHAAQGKTVAATASPTPSATPTTAAVTPVQPAPPVVPPPPVPRVVKSAAVVAVPGHAAVVSPSAATAGSATTVPAQPPLNVVPAANSRPSLSPGVAPVTSVVTAAPGAASAAP